MRFTGLVCTALAVLALVDCSTGDAEREAEAKATTSAASADPKSHVLQVTIRDVGGVSVYRDTGEGECISTAPKGFPNQLTVAGPDEVNGPVTLKSFEIPKTAQPSMGACESTMTITVPYRPNYMLDFGIEGQGGIANPDAPEPTWIATKGTSQKVTIVSQVVTTAKAD